MAQPLHAFNASIEGIKAEENRRFTAAYQAAQKADLFDGQIRTYQPLDDEGEQLPAESKKVRLRVQELLDSATTAMAALLDAELTQDTANAEAKADLVVAGKTLIKDVPVTNLLRLEKQAVHIATLIRALPVYDTKDEWHFDTDKGLHVTEPVIRKKTDKEPFNHVKWAPPDPGYKQEAQVDVMFKDVTIGHWTQHQLSGAISPERKRELENRTIQLIAAIRAAREQANTHPVEPKIAGKPVFDWLLA